MFQKNWEIEHYAWSPEKAALVLRKNVQVISSRRKVWIISPARFFSFGGQSQLPMCCIPSVSCLSHLMCYLMALPPLWRHCAPHRTTPDRHCYSSVISSSCRWSMLLLSLSKSRRMLAQERQRLRMRLHWDRILRAELQ